MKFLRNDKALKQRRRELRHNQTEAEKALWSHLRNGRFHGLKFFRQYSFGPYILDFYCSLLKLAVELDGSQHNQQDNKEYDIARTKFLSSYGIKVLRFWNHEVLSDMNAVITRMELAADIHHPDE